MTLPSSGVNMYLLFANMNTGDFGFSFGDIDDDGKFLYCGQH